MTLRSVFNLRLGCLIAVVLFLASATFAQVPVESPSPFPSPTETARPLYGLQGVLIETLDGRIVASQSENEQFNPASTMKLVDDVEEQALLERLLDTSKPPFAEGTAHLHPLLATPFRYAPRRTGSRFRDRDDPGVFYGAESVRTACMEMGYWRWRFLMDAPALGELPPSPFTAFAIRVRTRCVDLREAPFDRDARTVENG